MGKFVGLDLGGNSINVTAFDGTSFVIEGMAELPSLVSEGPETCVSQLCAGFELALELTKWKKSEITAVGLDTPGPISADGVLCSKGATNFSDKAYWNYDLRGALAKALHLPVSFLNDGNAAALYAHWVQFKDDADKTSVSLIVGTGLGGGVVANGSVLIGKVGFAAELGHVTLPGNWYPEGIIHARCNCGKDNDLESIASLTGIELNLLPYFLQKYPDHPLSAMPINDAAKKVRGFAERQDEMCLAIFRAQTYALAAHIDQMVNVFDPDAIFIGGGVIEAKQEFREWYLENIRNSVPYREEQANLPIVVAPDGDRAGARGAALFASRKLGKPVH
ncbi:MAG: ROK family protein [Fimbriimonas sp.]|nr:ROK family protein [Fimbriimonas sp.]